MKEIEASLKDYPGSCLIRVLDDDWTEYATVAGRKIYYNNKNGKTTWKPPRKIRVIEEKEAKKSSTWSLPATEDSVGVILKEGRLFIAKLWADGSMMKKKWHKYDGVLTDHNFVIVRNKKNKQCETLRLPLTSATVRKETGMTKRKHASCLTSKVATILLSCKDPVEGATWFHAITTVIDNLSKPKIPRPRSLIFPGEVKIVQQNDSFHFGHKTKPRFSLPRNIIPISTEYSLPPEIPDVTDNRQIEPDCVLEVVKSYSVESPKSDTYKSVEDLFYNLPPNFKFPTSADWIAKFDSAHERYVYENQATGEIWCAAKRENGGVYFYDTKSFATSLLLPSNNTIRKSLRRETPI